MMQVMKTIRLRALAMLTGLLLLAGCQEVLYSDLTEADANEMLALLQLSGIDADRKREPDDSYTLLVAEGDLAYAVTVLRNSGLPREKFSSLGEVFSDTGVVGTPFEERIRFAHATNEELSHTISQIKGVDRARVHVVIPPEERFGRVTEPARASVAVFHDASFQPTAFSGRIRTLVAFAVPGLEVENVSVSFFPTPGFVVQPTGPQAPPGAVEASPVSQVVPWSGSLKGGLPLVGLGMLLVAVLAVRATMLGVRRARRGRRHG